jgi:hypothetical protein
MHYGLPGLMIAIKCGMIREARVECRVDMRAFLSISE